MSILEKINFKRQIDLASLRDELSMEGWYCVKLGLVVIAVIVFMLITNSVASKKEGRVHRKKAELTEFQRMAVEYKAELASIGPLRKKLLRTELRGSTGSVIEAIAAKLGMGDKIVSFKPVEQSVNDGYTEKGVQVALEGVTLNEVVNFLYRVRGDRNLLLVKDFDMKSHFENPDLLDVTIVIVHVSVVAGSA